MLNGTRVDDAQAAPAWVAALRGLYGSGVLDDTEAVALKHRADALAAATKQPA